MQLDRGTTAGQPPAEEGLIGAGRGRSRSGLPALRPERPRPADLLAGVSVALVLVPQALAYAELAGLPTSTGLVAASLPLVAAAVFASSPYLQTGPVAVTALLTFGALEGVRDGGGDLVGAAALLALVVGITRLALGLARLGVIAYLMSDPVLVGFTTGAAVLIVASQLPTAVAAPAPGDDGVLARAGWTLTHPGSWSVSALALSALTVVLVVGGRRLHRLFPGVLAAVAVGLVWSAAGDAGPAIGSLPSPWPDPALALPWGELGGLVVGGVVIAVVGFAEPASIARLYATADRRPWSANRELVAQGAANLVAGVTGGLPVGGSFSRSAVNRLSGARTPWSGAVTGVVVLAFVPFASVLEPLPRSVLGAIVIASVVSLVRVRALVRLWRESVLQAVVATGTVAVTVAASPRVEWGVVGGVAMAVLVHLWRELRIVVSRRVDGDRCTIRPQGVLWFGSANRLEDLIVGILARHPEVTHVDIDLSGLGRVDYSGARTLRRVADDAAESGFEIRVLGVPPQVSPVVADILAGRS